MEKICLICTLGNRDIQFKKEHEQELTNILGSIFEKNDDFDSKELHLEKNNFLDNTYKILRNYDNIKDYITLPIIQPCFNYIKNQLNGTVEKIILIPTNQQNENVGERFKKGDTFIEAQIIEKILKEKGFEVEIKEAKFNAVKVEEWFKHAINVIDANYTEFDKLIFQVSGGVPQIREGIRLATLFKEKIEVVEVNGGKINSDNMKSYEKQIIKEKVKDLIKNYNYTGALSFKKYYEDNKEVLNLIEHLNYRLNFDFDNTLKCYNEDRLRLLMNEKNTIRKLEYLILELLDNMEIELKNKNYANFLARVYRLEEAVGQYFVLKWFEKTRTKISYKLGDNPPSGLINVADIGVKDLNNKLESYLKHLSKKMGNGCMTTHRGVSKLTNFIEENCKKKNRFGTPIIKDGKFEYIIKINTPTYEKLIKHLYGPYSKEIRIYEKIQKMYKKGHNNLRHTTIVAHGFEGINEDKINNMLKENGESEIKQYFEKLREDFYNLTGTDSKGSNNVFDKIGDEIICKL